MPLFYPHSWTIVIFLELYNGAYTFNKWMKGREMGSTGCIKSYRGHSKLHNFFLQQYFCSRSLLAVWGPIHTRHACVPYSVHQNVSQNVHTVCVHVNDVDNTLLIYGGVHFDARKGRHMFNFKRTLTYALDIQQCSGPFPLCIFTCAFFAHQSVQQLRIQRVLMLTLPLSHYGRFQQIHGKNWTRHHLSACWHTLNIQQC